MAASIRTGWAMTRSARLGSRRWALRWCGCGITSSLRIGTRRGSGSWRGLRGGGGRWWWWGLWGWGGWWAAAPLVGLPPSPRPSPSRERGSEAPSARRCPSREGGKRGLGPAWALSGERGWRGRLRRWLLFRPHPGPLPRGRGGKRGWRPRPGGGLWWAAGPLVAFPPSPRRSPSRERGEDCPSCCVLLTSCATLMSSRTRGVIIVLCLRHPYITHGPA